MHRLNRVAVYIFTKPQRFIGIRHNIVQYYTIIYYTYMRSSFIIITVNAINHIHISILHNYQKV